MFLISNNYIYRLYYQSISCISKRVVTFEKKKEEIFEFYVWQSFLQSWWKTNVNFTKITNFKTMFTRYLHCKYFNT